MSEHYYCNFPPERLDDGDEEYRSTPKEIAKDAELYCKMAYEDLLAYVDETAFDRHLQQRIQAAANAVAEVNTYIQSRR